MFQDVCLTSIQALCQLDNCISAPSRSHITPSTSQDVHLNSIQVPSQPHPGLERLPDSRVFYVSVESYLNLGPDIYISPTSSLHLTSIQVHQMASQFYPSIISNQYRFQDVCLTSIHVRPQLDPGPKILS